jgi:hypothetical protein
MTFARFSLAATALAFFFFGTWLLIQPEALGQLGIQLPTDSARVEIRAIYGGFEIGIGAFFLLALRHPQWYRPALLLQTLSLAGLGLTRLFAALLAVEPHPMLFAFCALELIGALVGALAYRRVAGLK